MSDLKTVEEVMKQIPHLEACINHMGCFNDFQIAMQLYAEQAIERCAELAELRYIPGCIDSAEIDKQSILGVKADLK